MCLLLWTHTSHTKLTKKLLSRRHMNNSLIHWGIPGMKWGLRKSRTSSSSGKNQKNNSKSSDSIIKKHGGESVSSFLKSIPPKALKTATTLVKVYAVIKVAEIAIPRIAWATGKVVSNVPLSNILPSQ